LYAFFQHAAYCIYRSVSTNAAVEFAWDERKNRVNRRKHRVSFETAIMVFDDPFQVSRQDREVDSEPRGQTIGTVEGVHILLVAHTTEERIGHSGGASRRPD